MVQYSCLITQKETRNKRKIKCLITLTDQQPETFVEKLQQNHCIEYQLVIYSVATKTLLNQLDQICKEKKTGLGKNWYDFSDVDLAFVISTYFSNGKVIFDYTKIADIVDHTLSLIFNDHKQIKIVVPSSEIIPLITSEVTDEQPRRRRKRFSIQIGEHTITRSHYREFLDKRCILDEKSRIHTVKLNDAFIKYLKETEVCDLTGLEPDDRQALFEGFIKLGFEVFDSGKKVYLEGLGLSKIPVLKTVKTAKTSVSKVTK